MTSILLVPNMTFAAAATATSQRSDTGELEELLLQLDLNRQGLDQTVLLLKSGGGELYAGADELKGWRLRLPEEPPLSHKEQLFYRLKAVPGLAYSVDEEHLTVSVTAPASAFLPNALDQSARHVVPPTKPGIGGFFNYDLLGERSAGQMRKSGLFELGSFNGFGVGVGSFVVTDAESTRFTRLETTWTMDLPSKLASLRLGDAISQSGMWGRSSRFAGIQYSTNFSVQPGLVTLPLQSVSGQTALPSTVDIYVNNNLASRTEVAPGPFSINNVPVVTGQGNVRVVVRDLLGREQVITQPFYASASLLTKGLQDFAYELGSVRENFGIHSDDYGKGFLAATHRIGITERLTGEMHAELQIESQTLGLGAAYLVPSIGIFSGAVASSRSPGGSGGLVSIGLERQASWLSFGLHTQLASENFTQLGLDPRKPAPRRLTNINVGIGTHRAGTVGLAYVFLDNRDGRPSELASVSYNVQLWQWGFLSIGLSRAMHQAGSTSMGANWTLPLGARTSSSVNVTQQPGRTQAVAEVQQGLPAGDGFGYVVQQGDRGLRNVALSAQNSVGTYSVEAASNQGQTGVRIGAAGGVALLDGVHLSRRITESFAVVELPDFPRVRIYDDNQLIGRTDEKGSALLPRLRAYERNSISVEQMDLPFDAKVDTLSLEAVPYFRSGTVLQFPVTRARDALLTINLEDGTALPAGALVKVEGQSEEFPVGHDGVVYLTGLTAKNHLHAEWQDQTCDLSVPFSSGKDLLPNLGTFVCTGVRP